MIKIKNILGYFVFLLNLSLNMPSMKDAIPKTYSYAHLTHPITSCVHLARHRIKELGHPVDLATMSSGSLLLKSQAQITSDIFLTF